MSESRVPHLPETEAALLGACLAHGAGWWKKVQTYTGGADPTDLFYVAQNRMVARAIAKVTEYGDSLSDASVADELDQISNGSLPASAWEIVIQLQSNASIETFEALQESVALLVQKRSARKMLSDANAIAESILNEDISPQEISRRLQKASTTNLSAKEVTTMAEFIDQMEDDSKPPAFCIPTGITELDKHLGGGFEGGRNYVIAARPKIGKTTCAVNICCNSLYEAQELPEAERPVIIFVSLETLSRDFMYKMVSAMGQLHQDATKAISYRLKTPEEAFDDEDDLEAYYEAMDILRDSDLYPVFPTDIPGGITSLLSYIMSVISRHPGRNVILYMDYIQLFVQNKANEYAELSQLTRDLKVLAMEEEIAVVYLSQLNREGAHGGMPGVQQLRGSGSLEQDVDVAIMLNRESAYDETKPEHIMHMEVALNRAGTTGTFELNWDGPTNSIDNLEEQNDWSASRAGA